MRSIAFKILPHGWSISRFGDLLAEPVRNGVYKPKEFHGRGQKIINMGELFAHDFISNQEMKRVELDAAECEKNLVCDGDLLFARRSLVLEGSGKCSLVVRPDEETTFESSIIRARVDRRVAYPKFYYYLFRSPQGRALMASIASRTAVSGITGTNLVELKVVQPPLQTQEIIASILSRYDDLIENNRRRMRICEEMARAIYREWFVELRAPGVSLRGATQIEKKLTGRSSFPTGWKVVALGAIATVDKGVSYKGEHLDDQGRPMVNLKCIMPGGGFRRDGVKGYTGEFKARQSVAPGDIVFANTDLTQAGNIVGSVARVPRSIFLEGGLASHHICIARPRRDEGITENFLHHSLEDGRFREFARGRASGTTVLGFRSDDAEQYPVVLPFSDLRNRFDEATRPCRDLAEVYEDNCDNLRRTRNLLLPELVSGEIDVENLDIQLSMASDGGITEMSR